MYEELMDYIMAYQDILTMANRVIEIWKKEYLKVSNELEQVKAEKEAAVKDCSGYCETCLFVHDCSKHDNNDSSAGVIWYFGDCEHWQWRGVQGGKDD